MFLLETFNDKFNRMLHQKRGVSDKLEVEGLRWYRSASNGTIVMTISSLQTPFMSHIECLKTIYNVLESTYSK